MVHLLLRQTVRAEDGIPADCEGGGIDRRKGFGDLGIGVYPELSKPMTKPGLHDRLRRCAERSAR